MYMYDQQGKKLANHSSGSAKRKGTIEFKRDLSAQSKVNVQRAMGVSESSANKNSVFIQRAEINKSTVQLIRRRRGQQPQNRPQPQPQPQPNPGYRIIREPDTLLPGQRNNILQFPRQSPIRGTPYYHIEGHYPPVGKPIWTILPGNRIVIVGMYRHGATNRIYLKNRGTGNGPNSIIIL